MSHAKPDQSPAYPARIVIGDDHPLVLKGLSAAMQEIWPAIDIIQCPTLDDVMAAAARHQNTIDLVLLDLKMPGSVGLSGLITFVKHFPAIPVIMISGQADADMVERAIPCGAAGYISKSAELDEMVRAISRVLDGEIWPPEPAPDQTAHGHQDYAKRLAKLSPQQMRILQLIVQGRLNKQIAGDLGIAEQTVKVHVSTIFRKLGVRTRTQAAVAVGPFLKS